MPERKIERIYIHCTVSGFGNFVLVNAWHKARKFLTSFMGYHISAGYHWIVSNGRPYTEDRYFTFMDGSIESARPDRVQGAGVRHGNVDTLHVVLVGNPGDFTRPQIKSLYKLLAWYVERGVSVEDVWGHYEYWTKQGKPPMKRCPGIDMNQFRADLKKYIETKKAPNIKELRIRTAETTLRKALDLINIIMGGKIDK